MAKNVEIIIKADDQASASLKKISDSAKGADQDFKRIKESGQQAKASTEAFAQVLSLIGQSELAGIAGAFTGIADKMRDIRGETEGWQAQTVAAKGIIAVGVFSAAVAVGKTIGDWVFQTEAANRQFERSKQLASDLAARIADVARERGGERIADVEQIADLEERKAAAMKLQAEIGKNLDGTAQKIAALTQQIEEREAGIAGWAKAWWGEYKQTTEIKKQELEQAEKLREIYREQNQQLLEIAAGEDARLEAERKQADEAERKRQASADYLQQLQKELELLQSQDKVQTQIAQNKTLTDEDRGRALDLARRIEAEKQQQEEQKRVLKEREQAEKQAQQDQKRNLQEQIAAQKQMLGALDTDLQGTESRLLTRGDGHDLAKQTADSTKATVEELEKQSKQLEELVKRSYSAPTGKNMQLEVVGT